VCHYEDETMKKQVHPAVIAVVVVLLISVVGFLFFKGTATPPPTAMNPLGPGAALLKAAGARPGGMTPDVLQAREKMQRQQGGTPEK